MDAIDREIVALIAERVEYVRAAAKFKTTSANVAAPERVAAVLKTRREWAEAVEKGRWPDEVRPFTSNRRHIVRKVI